MWFLDIKVFNVHVSRGIQKISPDSLLIYKKEYVSQVAMINCKSGFGKEMIVWVEGITMQDLPISSKVF